jgi:hypothetical protein
MMVGLVFSVIRVFGYSVIRVAQVAGCAGCEFWPLTTHPLPLTVNFWPLTTHPLPLTVNFFGHLPLTLYPLPFKECGLRELLGLRGAGCGELQGVAGFRGVSWSSVFRPRSSVLRLPSSVLRPWSSVNLIPDFHASSQIPDSRIPDYYEIFWSLTLYPLP